MFVPGWLIACMRITRASSNSKLKTLTKFAQDLPSVLSNLGTDEMVVREMFSEMLLSIDSFWFVPWKLCWGFLKVKSNFVSGCLLLLCLPPAFMAELDRAPSTGLFGFCYWPAFCLEGTCWPGGSGIPGGQRFCELARLLALFYSFCPRLLLLHGIMS